MRGVGYKVVKSMKRQEKGRGKKLDIRVLFTFGGNCKRFSARLLIATLLTALLGTCCNEAIESTYPLVWLLHLRARQIGC